MFQKGEFSVRNLGCPKFSVPSKNIAAEDAMVAEDLAIQFSRYLHQSKKCSLNSDRTFTIIKVLCRIGTHTFLPKSERPKW